MAFFPTGRVPVRRRLASLCVELWLPLLLVVAAWFASARSTSIYFPPLAVILATFERLWLFDQVASDVLPSLQNLAIGLGIATFAGITLGLLLGLLPRLHDALSPLLELLRAVPGVALLPLLLLLLGIGPLMRISVIAYATTWPILLNTIDGVRSVDPVVLDVARSYRLSRWQKMWRVILPAASPQIITGMRISLSLGVTVIFFSELVGSANGIGHRMLEYQRSFAIPEMWSGIILMGLLGYLLNIGFRGFEHIALRWHRGMQRREDV